MEEKFDNVALLPVINEKCDIIIPLLSSLCDNPDFLIDLLRKTTEKQNKFSSSRMKILHGHGVGADSD
jgi:hypothetical protein